MVAYRIRPFRRAQFSPIDKEPMGPAAEDSIRSLPDLINFNAEVNPDHTFCIQAEASVTEKGHFNASHLSFLQLRDAVDGCSEWLIENVTMPVPSESDVERPAPVALYMESDVGLFIYLAALLASGIPALLLSARLSPASVQHLLKETGAKTLLVSKRTERMIAHEVADIANTKLTVPYTTFLEAPSKPISQDKRLVVDENDTNVLILHSSGTTGLPKPIRLAHRYLLGYAACHSFPKDDDATWPNLSTLPLYHGFGLLAPCLSLSIGMTCCLPPSSTIPAAHSTLSLLRSLHASSLMSVPSILEDITALPPTDRARALSLLQPLHFIAIGGGPLKPAVGEALAAEAEASGRRTNLLNHYGATEIGAIAPIFRPGPDYDWRYLRLRTDLGLQLRQPVVAGGERYKLVGFPFGWPHPFEIQDDLEKRPVRTADGHVEVRILGRRDDLIVLKTGEKVSPRGMEEALSRDPAVKRAVCVGSGRFEMAVLVEAGAGAPADEGEFVERVWRCVERANGEVDQHARVSARAAVIVKPHGKEIPLSDKGSVMRKEVHVVFEEEIERAYQALERESLGAEVEVDVGELEGSVRAVVKVVVGERLAVDSWGSDDDFFELGMDSLQATRLARGLNSALAKVLSQPPQLSAAFIYRNTSIAQLADAIGRIVAGEANTASSSQDRGSQIQALADEYLQAIDAYEPEDLGDFGGDKSAGDGAVVLLTGSTGNLGAHTLRRLAQHPHVSRIICLNRTVAAHHLRARQTHINTTAGVTLTPLEWAKISFLPANTQSPALGLTAAQRQTLRNTLTHIVHLAWPMDFNRQLPSFRPQLNALLTLLSLARDAATLRPALRPRILLASSISVVRHYRDCGSGSTLVPEEPLADPLVTTAMGYAEAKWICERMLARVDPRTVTPLVVRIGQLSGPEGADGVWKTEEHIPALVKASQMIGAMPALDGDFSWIPVDRAAGVLAETLLQPEPVARQFYHLENPVRQRLGEMVEVVGRELGFEGAAPMPFGEWLERVRETGFAANLVEFFGKEFQSLADGSVTLDTRGAREVSKCLRESGGISGELIVAYVRRWKEMGFLA